MITFPRFLSLVINRAKSQLIIGFSYVTIVKPESNEKRTCSNLQSHGRRRSFKQCEKCEFFSRKKSSSDQSLHDFCRRYYSDWRIDLHRHEDDILTENLFVLYVKKTCLWWHGFLFYFTMWGIQSIFLILLNLFYCFQTHISMKKIYLLGIILLLSFKSGFSQITATLFSSGFTEPLDIKNCGDDRLFIVERGGLIKIIDTAGVHRPGNFLDIHTLVETSYNEEGLLGLAFPPDYSSSGYFYCYYIQKNTWAVRISRFSVSATNPDSAVAGSEFPIITIYHHFAQNHNGGDINFGPDGYLYFATGDGGSGNDPGNRSQNKDSLLGKMMRIDVSGGGAYTIPSTNPFVCKRGRDEIWAFGLRNPWRWSFDRWNGDLWIGDVGQDAWEEVDYRSASSRGGENYGWHCYEGVVHTPGVGTCSPPDTVAPVTVVAQTTGACAMMGGYVYRGAKYSNMFGKYFFSDECLHNIKYMLADGSANYAVTDLGALGITSNVNVAFGEDRYGELFLCDINGRIFKLQGQACAPVAFISDLDTIFVCGGSSTTLRTPEGRDFHYSWGGPVVTADVPQISVTQDGDYYVTVLDQNACIKTSDTVHVTFLPAPAAPGFSGLDTLICQPSGALALTPNPAGGYFSGCGVFGSSYYPDSVSTGYYDVTYTYTDEHGCVSDSVFRTHVDVCSGIQVHSFGDVSLFPNPNKGSFTLNFYLQQDELMNINVTDVLGRSVYSEEVHMNGGSHKMDLNIPNVEPGVYSLKLSDTRGSLVRSFVIN